MQAEAEPLLGKTAAGNVVLNRVASRDTELVCIIFDRRHELVHWRGPNHYNTPSNESIKWPKSAFEGYSLSDDIFLHPKEGPQRIVKKLAV